MELFYNDYLNRDLRKKTIYIVLTNTGSLPTRIIKAYTRAPYNHVSISFSKDLKELYSFGRKRMRNPLIGGFVKETIDNGIYAYFKDTTCSVYALEVDPKVYYKTKEVIRRFKRNKDKYGYSFIGLLGVIAKRPIEREYTFFCSEFVASVLEEGGLKLFNKPPSLVTPNDFILSINMSPIYVGKLAEYTYNVFSPTNVSTLYDLSQR